MNIPNGVTEETINNTEFEAGLILTEKYVSSDTAESVKAKVLCATSGGIKVNIAQQKQVVKFDGVLDNTAGIERVIGWTAGVQFNTKEVDKEKVLLALGFATDESNAGKIVLKQGIISSASYKDLYILGKLGNGTWRQITIKKAINVNGLQETRNDKNEVEIAYDLQARYTLDTQDTPPVEIEYIAGA